MEVSICKATNAKCGKRSKTPGRQQMFSFLPVHGQQPSHLANTVSCWYCDYKICACNTSIFRFGRRHASCFRIWYSFGACVGLALLFAVSLVLVLELGSWLSIFSENSSPSSLWLLDLLSWFNSLRPCVTDAFYLFLSTSIAVSVHEIGHAIAAASEGIQMEYIAIFVAVLFPGALVAFNYDALRSLHPFNALRVLCAGIWHNVLLCAVCSLILYFLPMILSPFYTHGESLVVLDVPSASPLSGYLYPGDVIVAVDGKGIHSEQEWMEMASLMNGKEFQKSNFGYLGGVHTRKAYCVPAFVIAERKKVHLEGFGNHSACPGDLTEFITTRCLDSGNSDAEGVDNHLIGTLDKYCLNSRGVVKFDKCSEGWVEEATEVRCNLCSQDESCLSPILQPGLFWVEITYSRAHSAECLQLKGNSLLASGTGDTIQRNCGAAFVSVGDMASMFALVQLTAYQPRWMVAFSLYLPKVLEKNLIFTFYSSLAMALLNSLPVCFLDGESILEMALCHFTWIGSSKRSKAHQSFVVAATLLAILALFRVVFMNFLA